MSTTMSSTTWGQCVNDIGSDSWDFTEFENLNNGDNLCRMIYSEARGESIEGQEGVYYVVVNRKNKNLSEFGGNTVNGVVLHKYQFHGMTTSHARCPDVSSQAWLDIVNIVNYTPSRNPIGTCLWFNTNSMYASRLKTINSKEHYTFDSGKTYREVVEKKVIGNHTFFRVSGY